MSTFFPTIPTGLIKLRIDYKALQLNFNQINNTYNTDHVALTDNSGAISPTGTGINGMHTVIHLNPQTVNPPDNNIANMLFSKVSTVPGGLQLFLKNNGVGGAVEQMSGNSPQTNGLTWASGIMFEWGFKAVTSSVSNGTVVFTTAFPNNLFNVTVTLVYTSPGSTPSGSDTQIYVNQNAATFTKNGFNFTLVTSSGSLTGFFFQAIGN